MMAAFVVLALAAAGAGEPNAGAHAWPAAGRADSIAGATAAGTDAAGAGAAARPRAAPGADTARTAAPTGPRRVRRFGAATQGEFGKRGLPVWGGGAAAVGEPAERGPAMQEAAERGSATQEPAPSADRWLAEDKARHFFLSFAATSLAHGGVRTAGLDGAAALAVAGAAGLAAGIWKELRDRSIPGETASVKDLVWDAVGVAAAVGLAAGTR